VSDAKPATVVGALALAVAAVSFAAVFILIAAPLHPAWIAGSRVLVTGTALLVIGARGLRPALHALRQSGAGLRWRLLLSAGLLALHFLTWVASLSETTVLRSTALVATQPLFAGLLGRMIGDRATWRLYAGAVVAIAGSVVLASEGDGTAGGSLYGDALALVGAAAAAGYLVVGRSVRDSLPLTPYLGGVHIMAGVALVAFATVVDGVAFDGVEGTDWLAVVAMGLIPGVIGHGLLNWAVRRLEVHVVSLAILIEPLGATILAILLLDRSVTGIEALGALVLLLGVAVGLPKRHQTP
jgi:drug/metabolite transporter (DMT)-like permease